MLLASISVAITFTLWSDRVRVANSCSRVFGDDYVYIDDLYLLQDKSNKVLIESSDNDCYTWNNNKHKEKSVSCNKYDSKIKEWSGETDVTNTTINEWNENNGIYTGFTINRNNENIFVDISNISSINSNWSHIAWTASNIFTTFIMYGTSEGSHPIEMFAVQFQSEVSNSGYSVYKVSVYSDHDESDYFDELEIVNGWDIEFASNNMDEIYIYSAINLVDFPIEYTSCDNWSILNYKFNTSDINNVTILFKRITTNTRIDERNYYGYEWIWSDELVFYTFELDENGDLQYTSKTYKLDLKNDDWVIIVVIICIVVILIGIGLAYYFGFYKKRKHEKVSVDFVQA